MLAACSVCIILLSLTIITLLGEQLALPSLLSRSLQPLVLESLHSVHKTCGRHLLNNPYSDTS